MNKSRFASSLFFLSALLIAAQFSARAAQPPRITLDPNGVSYIYPPFDTNGWVFTRGFGVETHKGDDHFAQDWAVDCNSDGRKLYAGISGEIFLNYLNPGDTVRDQGHGNTLVIYDADSKFALRYGHMQEFAPGLGNGSRVTAGQYIGKVGHTGNVEPSSACAKVGGHGAHLHIVLYKKAEGIDKRPVTEANFGASSATHAADFRYTTPAPLVKGDQRDDVYALFSGGYRAPVTWFVYNNQGWNFIKSETTRKTFLNVVEVRPQQQVDAFWLSAVFYPPRDGTLLRDPGKPTVYLMEGGTRYGVPGDIFNCRGYRFEDVELVSQGEIDRYPPSSNAPVLTGCIAAGGLFDSNPTFVTDASATPNPAVVNQQVTVNTTVISTGDAARDVIVTTEVFNSSNQRVFERSLTNQNFAVGQAQNYATNWTPTATGQYRVKVEVWNSSRLVSYSKNEQALTLSVNSSGGSTSSETVNIIPNVLYNGGTWSGQLWLRITGPQGTIVNREIRTPDETFAVHPGSYTVQYVSGGPLDAALTRIWAAQPCGASGATEVSCNFTSATKNHGVFLEFAPAPPKPGYKIQGRVTDPSGNGITGVDIVYGGARWTPEGVRILRPDDAFTDANGNYAIANALEGFTYNLTPLKQGFYFTPRSQRFENLSSDKTANFVGKPSPSPAPVILTEANTDRAVALDSVTMVRDPFPANTNLNLSPDERTRVSLFVTNLSLPGGEAFSTSDITVIAETTINSQTHVYTPKVEYVGRVPSFDWMSQVVFKFFDDPGVVGEFRIKLHFLGSFSNTARITIAPIPLEFMSFVEGDPQTAGDGIVVSASGGQDPTGFEMTQPIGLRGTRDGFTFTFSPPSDLPALNSMSFNIISLKPPGPCQATFGTGGGFVTGRVTLNGVQGSYVNIPQSQVNSIVQAANSIYPGCDFGASDLFIAKFYLNSSGISSITSVDAVAIGREQSKFPGSPAP